MSQLRAIVGARVSSYKDLKQTSNVSQKESGVKYAEQQGWKVVGSFEDLDISAGIYTPWERPDLGPWLTERYDEYDVIIWSKVDRAFRSMKDTSDVLHWAEQNEKCVVFTDDGVPPLDFTPEGRRNDPNGMKEMTAKMFLFILTIGAEMELKRIKQRRLDTEKALRQTDRWSGGAPPFGYKIVDHAVAGKTLALDPETSAIVRRAGLLVIGGASLWEAADALNADGLVTPSAHLARNAGDRPTRKRKISEHWNQTSIGRILQNPACMGWKVQGRSTSERRFVRGEDGLPIRISAPIFADEEWNKLQASIVSRRKTRERVHGAAPLLGVVHCDSCKSRLYRSKYTAKSGTEQTYYRCVDGPGRKRCKGYSFREDELTTFIDGTVLPMLTKIPVTRQVFVPGEDHTRELEHVNKALAGIRDERDMGAYDYNGGDEEYKERLTALVAQRKILEALPQREDAWVDELTGETYEDAYKRMDVDERRRLLLASNVRIFCSPNERHINVPRNLSDLAREFGNTLPELQVVPA